VGRRDAGRGHLYFSLIGATYWFAYFFILLPLLGVIEKPLPQPATIEEDFNAHYGPGSAHGAVQQPAE
jgi:ubiquinol-cytochrome c reductase cytochrome b subunit